LKSRLPVFSPSIDNGPTARFCSSFSARRRTMRFDVSGVDHLRDPRSTIANELAE
jgi:hypothetical protein